jgi:hypothetical protein
MNKGGGREPTRQPRHDNRLYCLVWSDHDLLKVGLTSGKNDRDADSNGTLTATHADAPHGRSERPGEALVLVACCRAAC